MVFPDMSKAVASLGIRISLPTFSMRPSRIRIVASSKIEPGSMQTLAWVNAQTPGLFSRNPFAGSISPNRVAERQKAK